MKQIDYIAARPLVEATGSGKQLDKVVQNIVNNLPANPSWDDIQDGFDKAKSYEQTKDKWGGGFGKGITANYFHRVAKKLGVEKVWADDGDRPTVISADGDTAGFFDPFNNDKDLAKQLNDKGMLSPAARFKYELRPPSAAKPDPIEEPKAEKPKEEPEGPRTQTGAGPLRFKDDDKPLDIDNLDDEGPNPKQYTANVKSCKDSFYYLQNLGKEYGLFFKSPRGEKLIQKGSQPKLDKLKKQKNDEIAKGLVNCSDIMSQGKEQGQAQDTAPANVALQTNAHYKNDTSGAATAGAAALGTAAFAAGVRKPKVPQAPALARPVKPTPDGKVPKPTPDGKLQVPSAGKKPVAAPTIKTQPGIRKPKPAPPQLPQGSKIVRRKATATPAMPNGEFKGPRATGAAIAEPKVTDKPRVIIPTAEKPPTKKPPKPALPDAPLPDAKLTPRVTSQITPRVAKDLKVPGSKLNPAATAEIPKLKLKGGKVVDLTPEMVKRYPRQTLKQIPLADMPDIPKLDLGRAGTIADMLKNFLKKLQGLTGPNIKSTLQKLKKLPTIDPSLRNLYGTFDNLGGKLDLGKLNSTEIGKLSNVGSLLTNELEPKSLRNFEKQLRDFDIDADTTDFKATGDLGPEPENRPLSTDSNLEVDRKTTFSTEPGDILKDLKTTPADKVPLKWFETPGVTDNIFKNYNIKKNSLVGRLLVNPALPDPPTSADFGKLATNKNLGLEAKAQDRLAKQLRQSYNGNGTIDLDKLKLNLAKLIKIDPTVDAYDPKRATEYVDGFDKQTFDFNVSDEIKDPIKRDVDDTKDRFADLEDSGIDKDATARAIRDRAQQQLKDIEAEMDKAEEITDAEKRAAKAAEIEDKLEQQRKDARANLSDVEGELTTAQKKAHRAHIAAIDDLKAELTSTTFTGDTTPGTMPGTPDAEKQALQVADELTNFARKIEKGTYPEIPAAELDALRAGDMPSSFHSKLEKGTYPKIPAAERQALLSVDPNTSFVSKAKPGTFPSTPEAERLAAMSGDDPKTRFVSDEKPGTFEPDTEMQAARDRIEELQKKSTKAAKELKQTELADQQFVKDYQDAITAEKIRHRQEILRLEKIQAQGQAGRDAAAEEQRAQAYKTEIDQLAADKQAAIQKGWEAITSQEAARGEQLVDDDTRKVLAQDAGIDDWEYDPTKATSQVNKAAAQQADIPRLGGAAPSLGTGSTGNKTAGTARPGSGMKGPADNMMPGGAQSQMKSALAALNIGDSPDITDDPTRQKPGQVVAEPKGAAPSSGNTAGITDKDGSTAQMPEPTPRPMDAGSSTVPGSKGDVDGAYKPKNFKPDMLLGQNFKELDDELAKAIDDSKMLQGKREMSLEKRNKELYDRLTADGKPITREKLQAELDNKMSSEKIKSKFVQEMVGRYNDAKKVGGDVWKVLENVAPGADAVDFAKIVYDETLKKKAQLVKLANQNKAQLIKNMGEELFMAAVNPKAAAKKAAVAGAKIIGKYAIAGPGLLLLALIDVYDIVNILVMLGVIKDPNDTINKEREESLNKVKAIMQDKSLDTAQKREAIKELLSNKEVGWQWVREIFGAVDVWQKQWGLDDELDNVWDDRSFMNETSQFKPVLIKVANGEEAVVSFDNIDKLNVMDDITRNPYKNLDIHNLYKQVSEYANENNRSFGYIISGGDESSGTLVTPDKLKQAGVPTHTLYYVRYSPDLKQVTTLRPLGKIGGKANYAKGVDGSLSTQFPNQSTQNDIMNAIRQQYRIPEIEFVNMKKVASTGSSALPPSAKKATNHFEKNDRFKVDVKGAAQKLIDKATFYKDDEVIKRSDAARDAKKKIESLRIGTHGKHSVFDLGDVGIYKGFPDQEVDAQRKHYDELLDLQRSLSNFKESRSTQLQGRIKLLRERIKQYKKVNIIKG